MTRSLSRGALLVALILGVIGGLAAPAGAHAQLLSTSPPAGAQLPRSPGQVVLHFGEAVELQLGSIQVFDSSAKRVDEGNARHVPGDTRAVEIGVPASLGAGGYVVTWRVISADSHPVHGAFTFEIGTGASTGQLRNEAAGLLSKAGGDRAAGVVFGVARFAELAGVSLLLGALWFLAVIWPGGRRDRRARRLVWGALALTLAGGVGEYLLQGPYGSGLGLGRVLDPNVLAAVWHSRYGRLTVARVIFVAALGVAGARLLRRADPARATVAATAGIGVAVVATLSLAGHAATGSLVPVALPFDVIHVAAGAVWFGGLAVLLVAVLPARRTATIDPLPETGRRYSQWALAAVVAIVVSGGFAAWRQIGTFAAVTTTAYGRLVLAKVVAFALVVVIAAVISRVAMHGSLAIPGRPVRRAASAATVRRFPAAIAVEAAVLVVVLGLTAVLVNAVPARQAYAAPFSKEVHAGPDLVDTTLAPAKAGPMAFHVYVLTPDGAQLDVPEVTATMSQPSGGITALTVPLSKAGPGHFVAYNFNVPIRGTWQVLIRVRVSDIDEYNADLFSVHIR